MCATGCGGCNDCGGVTLPDGPAGIDGKNAFTVTTAAFTVPVIGSNVTFYVSALGQATGSWAVAGQTIFIVDAGYYLVVSSTYNTITATNLGTTGNAANPTVIALGAGVSPAGVPGVDGVNGTSELVTRFNVLSASTTGYTPLHTAYTIPANTFQAAGDIMRITFTSVGTDPDPTGATTNYYEYEHKIEIGGVSLIIGNNGDASFKTSSRVNANGAYLELDLIPTVIGATPVFVVSINRLTLGYGFYNGTNGSVIIPANLFLSNAAWTNPFVLSQTTGIGATTGTLSFLISGKLTAVGTPTSTPSFYLPVLKIQMIKL